MKIALITGITGQDGSYLAELLLAKKYEVHGIIRRSSNFNTSRIDHLYLNKKNKLHLHFSDLIDDLSIYNLINKIRPNEIYNLAAQSHVKVSFELPVYTSDVNGLGCLKILEAIVRLGLQKKTKFYQASSSEMFGNTLPPQNENSKFSPQSVYAISKLFSYYCVKLYREAYGCFAANGILFNHESSRRGNTFVTKKIVDGLIKISKNQEKEIILGNLYSKRDWGHAKDYVEGMWKILQQEKPDDFVLSTNNNISVKEFLIKVANKLKIQIVWKGKGINEIGINKLNNKTIIRIDKKYFRPAEVDNLLGDYSKAKKKLKWKPKHNIDDLVEEMINNYQD